MSLAKVYERLEQRQAAEAIIARATPRSTPAPWELLTHSPDPRERLIEYLDAWASMDEAVWPEANARTLYEDIMDIFWKHPEADGWFRDWRAAHPEARLE